MTAQSTNASRVVNMKKGGSIVNGGAKMLIIGRHEAQSWYNI